MKQLAFSFGVVLLLISSCKKEEITEPIPTPQIKQDTYTSVKSIIDNTCTQCHAENQNAYIPDFTTYNNISGYLQNPANTFVDRLNSDDEFYKMPPNGELSQEDKDRLIEWVNDGYIE